MTDMFCGCVEVTDIVLGDDFNTSKVFSMEEMFADCTQLKNINISNWDTSNLANVDSMFTGCENITELDLSSFDTSKVKDFDDMFFDCSSLEKLDISSFVFSEEADCDSLIDLCFSLKMIICPKNVTMPIELPVEEYDKWFRSADKEIEIIPKSNTPIVITKNEYSEPVSMSSVVVEKCNHGGIFPFSTTEDKKIKYDSRAVMCFDIRPDKGYLIDDVIVDNESIGDVCKGSYYRYYFPVSEIKEHKIEAKFTQIVENELNYKIEAVAGNNGKITPSGIVKVNPNDSQEFTVTANDGYKIKYVLIDGEVQDVEEETVEYKFALDEVDGDHVVKAYFEKKFEDLNPWHDGEKLITATCEEHGKITPAGETYVKENEDITFTITPDEGYAILEVIVDGESKGAIDTYTFKDVTKEHKIEAKFYKYHIINAIKTPNGIISPQGERKVKEGDNAFLLL